MSDPQAMTPEEQAVIDGLKARGFAVIVWTPEEIGPADAGHLEEVSVERGWNFIRSFFDENDEEAE